MGMNESTAAASPIRIKRSIRSRRRTLQAQTAGLLAVSCIAWLDRSRRHDNIALGINSKLCAGTQAATWRLVRPEHVQAGVDVKLSPRFGVFAEVRITRMRKGRFNPALVDGA